MQPKNEPSFELDLKKVFIKEFCHVCKNERFCPLEHECKDLIKFMELSEDVRNGNSTKEVRP